MRNRILFAVCLASIVVIPDAASQSSAGRTLTVDPTRSQDLTAQINAFIATCPVGTPCTIRIPPGTYNVDSGTINIASPAISILGDSASGVLINYRGTNFLKLDLRTHFTIAPAGRISGFTLHCTAAGATCITAGSVVGASFEDLDLVGPGGQASAQSCNNSTAFQFQNAPGTWMERWQLRHIEIGGFCKNLHFQSPGAGDAAATSFGYGMVDGLWTNQGAGSRGVEVDAGVSVYHVLQWTESLNAAGTTADDEAFHIAGDLDGTNFGFDGETGASTLTFAHLLPGAKMIFAGNYRIYGRGATGARLEPGAGAFFIGPYSGDSGVSASTGSSGAIANFGKSGKTVDVYPVQQMGGVEAQNPGLTAGLGYVVSRTPNASPSSPFFVFDPGIPFCLGTIQGSYLCSKLSEASPVFFIDGSCSIVHGNGATLAGPVSATAFKETLSTPSSSSAPCSPGEFTDDTNFHYVCVARNTWKRVALSNF